MKPPPRVQALQERFEWIHRQRMAGLPMCHTGLQVRALGFAAQAPAGWLGVLVTPWFMNLVWLPPSCHEAQADTLAPGQRRERQIGAQSLPFLGSWEEGVGAFEACSLFSPMFEFTDQAAARETARAVLAQLRSAPEPAAAARVPVSAVVTAKADATPARRSFLFGRSASAAARP